MNSPLSHEQALLASSSTPAEPFAWVGELAGFLRRNRKLLLASVATLVLLALLYIVTARPQFTASATLLVDLSQAAPLQQHPSVTDAQIENAMIESEVEVLRSAGLARKVVAGLHLATEPAFVGAPSLLSKVGAALRSPFTLHNAGPEPATAAADRLVQQFLGAVAVHRIGLTYIIEIDATAKTPDLAARLANGLTNAYLAEQLVVRDASTRQAAGWQEARLAQLQDQALKADQQVQLFKSRNGIVDTGHGLLNEQQLTELNSRLVAARGRTAEASARLDRIRQMTRPGSDPAMAVSDVLTSPVINGLRERYLNDATKVAQWTSQYGRGNGAAALLRKEMVQLQAAIGSEIRRIEQAAESDVAVDRSGEAAIQAQLDKLVGQAGSTDTARATLRSLQSSADTYRSLYVAFLQRAMQTAQEEAYPVANARVVTEARPPLTKSKPQTKPILAAAVVFGLGIGFALGLLREALDRRLRTPSDLLAATGLFCLASLPNLQIRFSSASSGWGWGGRSAGALNLEPDESVDGYALGHPDTPFGLGMRRLQLRLLQQQGGTGRSRLVGLVAPRDGNGTSTVAASLVQLLTASGHAAVRLVLSEEPEPRSQIRSRIETLRREYEFVVVDFPALDRPTEAHTLFADLGSLVLVVEAGRLEGPALLESLHDAGLERRSVSGVVLNRVRSGT